MEEEDEAEIENSVHESSSEDTGRPDHISKQDLKSKKAAKRPSGVKPEQMTQLILSVTMRRIKKPYFYPRENGEKWLSL